MRTINTKQEQLLAMLESCRGFGVELCANLEQGYFTAIAAWGNPVAQKEAEHIQKRIKELSRQYPNVVCYCFEADSTLVYVL